MKPYLDAKHAVRSQRRVEKLLEGFSLGFASRALEVGCGRGVVSIFLARQFGLEVTAVDLDPDAINLAKQEAKLENSRVNLVRGNALSLPFIEKAFDLVLGLNMLHHTPDWRQALREMDRVLGKKGWLALIERYNPELRWVKGRLRVGFHGLPKKVLEKELMSLNYSLARIIVEGKWAKRYGIIGQKNR